MLTKDEMLSLEKKYFNALKDLLSFNISKIITQINSQKLYLQPTETDKANSIEHAIENIIEQLIAEKYNWLVASLPASADSCYELGDAVIHIDAKTGLIDDGDYTSKKVNVQEYQTTYDSESKIFFNEKKNDPWQPKLKHYETHDYYGVIPNLTYVVKLNYSEKNLVEEITLLSLPHGIFYDDLSAKILGAGKSKEKEDKDGMRRRNNIRFLFNEILKNESHKWRETLIYKHKAKKQ